MTNFPLLTLIFLVVAMAQGCAEPGYSDKGVSTLSLFCESDAATITCSKDCMSRWVRLDGTAQAMTLIFATEIDCINNTNILTTR